MYIRDNILFYKIIEEKKNLQEKNRYRCFYIVKFYTVKLVIIFYYYYLAGYVE